MLLDKRKVGARLSYQFQPRCEQMPEFQLFGIQGFSLSENKGVRQSLEQEVGLSFWPPPNDLVVQDFGFL
jgi:hypothetical protein